MKRLIVVAVLVATLAAVVLTGTALAQGTVPPPNGGWACPGAGMMGGWRGTASWRGLPDEVETLLGMTAEQIQAERLAGKSLVEIAASKGVSEETLVSTILNAKKADLDALVAAGKLTQAQADFIYDRMEQTVPVMVNRTDTGPMWRGQGQSTPPSGIPGRGGRGMTGGRGMRW